MKERENESTITTKEALNAIYRNGKRRVKKFFKKYGKHILVGTGAGALGYFVYTNSVKRQRYYIDKQHINNSGVIEGDLNLVDITDELIDEEDDDEDDEDEE